MIRERVAERIFAFHKEFGNTTPWYKSCASDILAITNPPLTVTIPCDKCGGSQLVEEYNPKLDIHESWPCTCTDGRNEREIERWVENGAVEPEIFTLTPHDLIDVDIAWAYASLEYAHKKQGYNPIPNNKGVLRVKS